MKLSRVRVRAREAGDAAARPTEAARHPPTPVLIRQYFMLRRPADLGRGLSPDANRPCAWTLSVTGPTRVVRRWFRGCVARPSGIEPDRRAPFGGSPRVNLLGARSNLLHSLPRRSRRAQKARTTPSRENHYPQNDVEAADQPPPSAAEILVSPPPNCPQVKPPRRTRR
jgi:hypothetical protein